MSRSKLKKQARIRRDLRDLLSKGFVLDPEKRIMFLFTGNGFFPMHLVYLNDAETDALLYGLRLINAQYWDYQTYSGYWLLGPSNIKGAEN